MMLMILYNLFIYLTLRDTSYLYYVTYVFSIAFFSASMDGYAFRYFWPTLPFLNPYEDILAIMVGISGILFASSFLNTKENAPLLHKILTGFLITYIGLIFIIISRNFLAGTIAVEITSLALTVCVFVAAVTISRKGYKPATYFLIAWALLLVSIIVFILKDFHLFAYNKIAVNALKLGSGAEVILLSIALADRIHLYREEKAKVQLQLIDSLQEKSNMQHDMLELEAQALRSQMNPHFIFNCMNSIKVLIQQKDEDRAVHYLTTFSKLLRTILQNLNKREISLFDEMETCRLYTQLESMRFENKFGYSFSVDVGIDPKSIRVPALILQPFIENAIWHGIMPKEEGYIKVTVEKKDDVIECVVDDNGIGRELSRNNSFRNGPSTHESKGVTLTQSRLDLDNALHKRNATVRILDKKDENGHPAGTTVILTFKEYLK
jgi:sensor histidine kinase YesM